MYNSPIEKIFGEIQNEIKRKDEEHLMMAVNQSVGYAVDKTELLKALQYDRRQYEKGYTDAMVEYGNKWIPVSEKLPAEETDVLICNSKGNIEVSRGSVFDDGTWEWYTSGWHFGEVLAWMPLPKPYKAEMEG